MMLIPLPTASTVIRRERVRGEGERGNLGLEEIVCVCERERERETYKTIEFHPESAVNIVQRS